MKRLLLSLTLASIFTVNIQAADINAISNAFKGGNASSLSGNMDKEVEIAFAGETGKKCSGGEAVSRLKTFFASNKPSNFRVLHHADKKENGFFVAKMSAGSKEYRVNVTYRAEGNKVIIQSIRIE